jgi:anti-sigma B factor antagonist
MNMEHEALHVTSGRIEGAVEVVATGELDLATAADFVGAVREQLRLGAVVIDLCGVTFMDSSGVRALEALLRAADEAGAPLAVRPELAENVRQVLTMTGLIHLLPVQERA